MYYQFKTYIHSIFYYGLLALLCIISIFLLFIFYAVWCVFKWQMNCVYFDPYMTQLNIYVFNMFLFI